MKPAWFSQAMRVSGQLFDTLAQRNYIPNVAGSGERWHATINGNTVCSFGKDAADADFCVAPDTGLSSMISGEGFIEVKLVYQSSGRET